MRNLTALQHGRSGNHTVGVPPVSERMFVLEWTGQYECPRDAVNVRGRGHTEMPGVTA